VSNSLVADLRDIVGSGALLVGSDAERFSRDWRDMYGTAPRAVVRPANRAEVAATVRVCVSAGVALVTQGGNTSMSGGAVLGNDADAIILSTGRMNTITDLNVDANTVTAEAGCTIEALQDAAAESNRTFAPDWGARGSATIGGAVATNAGGINVLRYGTMRQNVLGVEAVLADGTTLDTRRGLRKDASGYDLTHLMVGSEGTLGIVTSVTATLHPATNHAHSAIASLPSLDALMPLFAMASEHASGSLCAFELIPEVGIARVCEMFGEANRPIGGADWYALMKLASARPVLDELTSLLGEAASANLIIDASVAASPEQESNLWMIRDELPPTGLYAWHAAGIKGDTAVPIDRIGEYHDRVRALVSALAPDALCYGFGHVGDGNLHMMVLPADETGVAAFSALRAELIARLDELTWEMGGTISAEHGVGQALGGRISGQRSSVERATARRIRDALDPDRVFNPQVEF
jgi:FAD/FMN-containing dehydrogenase